MEVKLGGFWRGLNVSGIHSEHTGWGRGFFLANRCDLLCVYFFSLKS